MPDSTWSFNIIYNCNNPFGTTATGIYARSPDEVDRLGEISGLKVETRNSRRLGLLKKIGVREPEESQRLKKLLEALNDLYGLEPSKWFIIPASEREKYFGVRKERTYSEDEISKSDFLYLYFAENAIAEHKQGKADEIGFLSYQIDGKENKKICFGFLSPYHALAVNSELKEKLIDSNLCGFETDLLPRTKNLWKVSSSVLLPPSKTRIVNEQGEDVQPDKDWLNFEFECCYFDDGYIPPEISYLRSDIEKMKSFDVTKTVEITGNHSGGAYPWIVVSQRFRELMKELKISGIKYVPIRLV